MNNMVNIIPLGSCPKCGHKQFIVSELQINEYLTNQDGEIIDSLEIDYDAEGICCNCNTKFKMYPTREGFIPLTRLREILFDFTQHVLLDQNELSNNLKNPMEVDINAR